MSLICCSHCNNSISEFAKFCPKCGNTTVTISEKYNEYLPKTAFPSQCDVSLEVYRASLAVPLFKEMQPSFSELPNIFVETCLLFNQGQACFEGTKETPLDYDRAFGIFNCLLLERNMRIAAYYLGMMYELGLLVPQDYQQAFHYYQIAATDKGLVSFTDKKITLRSNRNEVRQSKLHMARLLYGNKVFITNADKSRTIQLGIICYLAAIEDGQPSAKKELDVICHRPPSNNSLGAIETWNTYPNILAEECLSGNVIAKQYLQKLYHRAHELCFTISM